MWLFRAFSGEDEDEEEDGGDHVVGVMVPGA